MKKYESYKESGIEWIGEIPMHWEVGKVSHLFSFSRGLPITKQDLRDEGIPCVNYGEVHSKYGFRVNPEEHLLKCVELHYLKTNEKSILGKGDFVFADTSEDIEGSGNFTFLDSEVPTFAGYHTIIARIKGDNEYKYLGYFFDSPFFRNQIRSNVSGVKVFSITQAILKNSSVLLPEIQEQTVIAQFLDRKTAEIDELIADKKRLLELYEEEKTAIINQAVTKGINPNVAMKDSGIEWLGKIPEHWEVKPIKHEIAKRIDNRGRTPEFGTEGIPMLEVKQLSENSKYPIEQFEKYVQPEILKHYLREELWEGDILIATVGATAGKCCIVPANPYYFIAQNVIGFRFKERNNPNYFYYLIQSDFFKNSLYSINKSNTIDNLKVSVFIDNIIPVPDSTEQETISSYIESNLGIIDIKVSKTEQLIELLTEYRTVLISEVVTGKVKIIE